MKAVPSDLPVPSQVTDASVVAAGTPMPQLAVDGLCVDFSVGRGRQKKRFRAVDDVTFQIRRGETVGLVGESGSGKSTVARAIIGIAPVAAGTIRFDGVDYARARGDSLRRLRRRAQMIYQDPYSSLNPRFTVRDLIEEPLRVHLNLSDDRRQARVLELLDHVRLSRVHLSRRPSALSGGQRQRVAIARALAVEPALLLCDEPVSALDVSTQAQIVNTLEDLQRELGVSLLFVSHDLSVVEHICHRTAVMYRGSLVEVGESTQIDQRPAHPYTANLLAAAPRLDPHVQAEARRERQRLNVDPADDVTPTRGCRFAPRCAFAQPECNQADQRLRELAPGHSVACRRAEDLDLRRARVGR